ncbi:hypothetical protein GOV12_01860 [Candidatus Pacearchaeota archaeon]|nr:hypothetical protein [Candidatus Pacearchaeota archaeon]
MEKQVISQERQTGLQLVEASRDGQIIAHTRTSLDLTKEAVEMQVSIPEIEYYCNRENCGGVKRVFSEFKERLERLDSVMEGGDDDTGN